MGDRGDPRIHLYEPGLIRRIKNEVKTDKARQIEAFHHIRLIGLDHNRMMLALRCLNPASNPLSLLMLIIHTNRQDFVWMDRSSNSVV